jgi:hypothetical protein
MSGVWFVSGGWLSACATTSTWHTSSVTRQGFIALGALWFTVLYTYVTVLFGFNNSHSSVVMLVAWGEP